MTNAVMVDLDGTLLSRVGAAGRPVVAWAAELAPRSGGDAALIELWTALGREYFGV